MEKMKDYGWSRGNESEEKVLEVLEELRAQGIIKNCGRSFQFGKEDLAGIDMIIITLDDKAIYLQVKSGLGQVEKYEKRGIHCLNKIREKTRGEIKKEILEILRKRNQTN